MADRVKEADTRYLFSCNAFKKTFESFLKHTQEDSDAMKAVFLRVNNEKRSGKNSDGCCACTGSRKYF